MQSEKEFQVYFRTPEGRTIAIMLPADFTFEVFKKIGNEVMASRHDEIQGYYFAVSGRSISMENRKQFDGNKHLITKECNIFILGRLLGGRSFPDTLQEIVEQELKVEISKADTHTSECSICLDDDTNCVKVCCTWMCGEDFERWILDKQFKASCTVCSKAIHLGSIFKSAEFIATIQALQDERQLLKNIDCQRCLDCNALMHNETMLSHQTCIVCRREFCFFCNRKWDSMTMTNNQNTCGKSCVYQSMITFQLERFQYNPYIMIPSCRTCPRCFNYGGYDRKCKYHSCEACKFDFCFLCLQEQAECVRKYKSRYDHVCVATPVVQTYDIFPRLILK